MGPVNVFSFIQLSNFRAGFGLLFFKRKCCKISASMSDSFLTNTGRYYINLSLTAKVRRLPLFRRSTGFFGHAKCSYILLLFCLGCPYDFSHIYIRYDLIIRTETGRFVKRIRQIGSCVNRCVSKLLPWPGHPHILQGINDLLTGKRFL